MLKHLQTMQKKLIRSWYSQQTTYWLLPFGWLFRMIVWVRYRLYHHRVLRSYRFNVPVIIVGNISVGGTGKTPCVIALVDYFRQRGLQPGIVSRGYGGRQYRTPYTVETGDLPTDVGDEALLLKQRCQCPVVIAKQRAAAVHHLLKTSDCNVIISDDGLQHYALARTYEIVMIDGERGFGNQMTLPAGPLREPLPRLQRSDALVVTGDKSLSLPSNLSLPPTYSMPLKVTCCYALQSPSQQKPLTDFTGQCVHGVAAIGHPERFFQLLVSYGIQVIEHAFADHHHFELADFAEFADKCILLTEKDAVKCQSLQLSNAWVVQIQGHLPDPLCQMLYNTVTQAKSIAGHSLDRTL